MRPGPGEYLPHGLISSRIGLNHHSTYLHIRYNMPGRLGTLHDWLLCKGHFLDFLQSLKRFPLPGEIGGYSDPISLTPLTYRQPTAQACLHISAPYHQLVSLIDSMYPFPPYLNLTISASRILSSAIVYYFRL